MSNPRPLQADTLHGLLARANAAKDCVSHGEMTLDGYDRMIARWVVDANIAPVRSSREIYTEILSMHRTMDESDQDPRFRRLREEYSVAQRVEIMIRDLGEIRSRIGSPNQEA